MECGVDARKRGCRFGSSAPDSLIHLHPHPHPHPGVPATGLPLECGEPGADW